MILKSNQNFVGKMLLLKMITEIKLVLTSNSGIKKIRILFKAKYRQKDTSIQVLWRMKFKYWF